MTDNCRLASYLVVLPGLVVLPALGFGQTDSARPVFEAASVRAAAPQANGMSGMRGGPETPDPGRIAYTNVTLKFVLGTAYDMQDDQISGPAWLEAARYDIAASIPKGVSREQFRMMLQGLVAERFSLTLHREKKDFVVWELSVAKNGPKLKAANASAEPVPTASGGGRGPSDSNGFPIPPPHQTAQRAVDGVAKLAGRQVTMATLAQFLKFPMAFIEGGPGTTSMAAGRVVDKTGLSGEYDLTLSYQWPGFVPPGADPDLAPSIFTAVEQQLGLKLQKTKQSLDVLVIDHAEKEPTEN